MAKKFSVMDVLNNQSNNERKIVSKSEIELISVHKLIASENNFYDTTDILDLKDSIEMLGIKQNLVVVKVAADQEQYRVIAGHRRMMAVRALLEEGKNEFELVPCRVESDIDAIKEEMLLIYTNSTTRPLSDYEKLEQFKRLKVLVVEYKKTNAIPGRVRDLIAESLNVSPATVNRLEQVDKKLNPEFKRELKEQKISMDTAVELAKLDKDTQDKALKNHKEKPLKKKDVEKINAETKDVPSKQKLDKRAHIPIGVTDIAKMQAGEIPAVAQKSSGKSDDVEYAEIYENVLEEVAAFIDKKIDCCDETTRRKAYKEIKAYLLER